MKQTTFFVSRFLSAFLVAIFLALFFCTTSTAQGVEGLGSSSFSLSLNPEFPGSSQQVTARVTSNLLNLNESSITWKLNGKTQLQGVGKKDFIFSTGEVGVVSSLEVSINTTQFGMVTKSININPSGVDVLWEANTYTPPFYKGKALPTSQSFIKMVGIPNFISKSGKVSSNNLVYSWKKGYTPNPDDSGVGKNVFIYRGTYTLNTDTIETMVSTLDKSISTNKKTAVSIIEPKIIFYERKPLEGIRYENALTGSTAIKEQEITLRSEPYFFSFLNANTNSAMFTWKLDGKSQPINPDKKAEFTFGKPEKGSGTSGIQLKIANTGYDLQTTVKNISLSYTN